LKIIVDNDEVIGFDKQCILNIMGIEIKTIQPIQRLFISEWGEEDI